MMKKNQLDKFYMKTIEERIEALIELNKTDHRSVADFKADLILPEEISDHMIENVVGTYQLPLGLALHFLIDGQDYLIPMATEEPSVVAAASFAAKTIRLAGGFTTEAQSRMMIGQVALKDIDDKELAIEEIIKNQDQIISIANSAHPSIVKRGGGAQKIDLRWIDKDDEYGTPHF